MTPKWFGNWATRGLPTRGLDKSRTGQLAVVFQSASWQSASWRIRELSSNQWFDHWTTWAGLTNHRRIPTRPVLDLQRAPGVSQRGRGGDLTEEDRVESQRHAVVVDPATKARRRPPDDGVTNASASRGNPGQPVHRCHPRRSSITAILEY